MSFVTDEVPKMPYPEFLKAMKDKPTGFTLRDSSSCVEKVLEKDIIYPEFYHPYAEFEAFEII